MSPGSENSVSVTQQMLEIRVVEDDWGDARTIDITRVLESAGQALAVLFPSGTVSPIEVSRTTSDPITLRQRGHAGETRVRLNVEGRHWARFAFQFGHEMGHILCKHADYPNPNLWFEESVCEAASLFVLGRMAETWATSPPFANWAEYAPALQKYRDDRLEDALLPESVSLSDVFRKEEESLRGDPHQRQLNLKIAMALLPLFEETPEHWPAVENLNATHGDPGRAFARYLGDWWLAAPEKHRDFILRIASRLDITIER